MPTYTPEKDSVPTLPSLGQYRYTLMKQLDHTRMSEVWLARALDTGEQVVVKLAHINNYSAANQQAISAEARIIPRLQHDCLIQLHPIGKQSSNAQKTFYKARATDFPHDEAPWFIVMEYLEGGSLKQFMNKHSPLPPRLALHIVQRIATTLVYLHANGIIHSDIKPSNIVFGTAPHVRDAERLFTLYVIDFGIAIELDSDQAQFVVPQGSNPWWAPEAELAKKEKRGVPADPSWDIYGMALILQSMLTGQHPSRDAKKRYTGVTLKLSQFPDNNEEIEHDEIETRINSLLQRSIDTIPVNRPSAIEFADELDDILALLAPAQASYGWGQTTLQTSRSKGNSMNQPNKRSILSPLRYPRLVSIAITVLTTLLIALSLWAIGPEDIYGRITEIADSQATPLPPTSESLAVAETVVAPISAPATNSPSVSVAAPTLVTVNQPTPATQSSELSEGGINLELPGTTPTETRAVPATATRLPLAVQVATNTPLPTARPTATTRPTRRPTRTPTQTPSQQVVNPIPRGEIAQPIVKAEGAEQDHGCVVADGMRDTWSRERRDRMIIIQWRWTQEPSGGKYQIGMAVSQDDLRNLNVYLVGDPVSQPRATINAQQAHQIFEANGAYSNGAFNASSDHYWGIFHINAAGRPLSLLSPTCRFKFGGE